MNKVFLIGRLVKDSDLRYNKNNTAVCRFTIAIDRPKQKDKEYSGADFPSCVCFNNVAVNLNKYVHKGDLIAVDGRLQTGSYDDKDGKKIYTTDVVVNKVMFLNNKNNQNEEKTTSDEQSVEQGQNEPNYEQLGTKTIMDEEYNPELQIDDSDLPF